MAVLKTDPDLTTRDLAGLTSADALAAFLNRLAYDTSRRTVLTPASLGLSGDTASAWFKRRSQLRGGSGPALTKSLLR